MGSRLLKKSDRLARWKAVTRSSQASSVLGDGLHASGGFHHRLLDRLQVTLLRGLAREFAPGEIGLAIDDSEFFGKAVEKAIKLGKRHYSVFPLQL